VSVEARTARVGGSKDTFSQPKQTASDRASAARAEFYAEWKDGSVAASNIVSILRTFAAERSWTLLKNGSGGFFKTFEEFCETRRPYGLGAKYAELRFLWQEALKEEGKSPAEVKKEIDLGSAPPDGRAGNGANQYTGPVLESADERLIPESGHSKANSLRAISRAPEAARDLYTRDLLPQKLAAKLGPKNPSPEIAARMVAIAQGAAQIVKDAPKPRDEKEKRALRAKVVKHVSAQLSPTAAPTYERKGEALVKQLTSLDQATRDDVLRRASAAVVVEPRLDPPDACPKCQGRRFRDASEKTHDGGSMTRWACVGCGHVVKPGSNGSGLATGAKAERPNVQTPDEPEVQIFEEEDVWTGLATVIQTMTEDQARRLLAMARAIAAEGT
jgi:hypothetical protein